MKWYEDKRAIGLLCIFSGNNRHGYTCITGFFNGLDDEGYYICQQDFHPSLWTNCRLAQGEKTAYDGKGQPVPDGVMVMADNMTFSVPSQDIRWNEISTYTVMEQPMEKTKPVALSTIERVIECLEAAKRRITVSNDPSKNNAQKVSMFLYEIKQLDALIQELTDG